MLGLSSEMKVSTIVRHRVYYIITKNYNLRNHLDGKVENFGWRQPKTFTTEGEWHFLATCLGNWTFGKCGISPDWAKGCYIWAFPLWGLWACWKGQGEQSMQDCWGTEELWKDKGVQEHTPWQVFSTNPWILGQIRVSIQCRKFLGSVQLGSSGTQRE